MEDLSDRECEVFLQENVAGKWFCGFGLAEPGPDHTVLCRVRKKIGTKRLSDLFSAMRDELSNHGLVSEVFTFVDATHLIVNANLWKERDKAIKEKYEKLNNEVLLKVARIGCKGKDKYWYGHKQHTAVDMQSGLINKLAITPANVTDAKGSKHICPNQGAVHGDKGYCTEQAQHTAKARRCHLTAILKNNMLDKNKNKDRWYSEIRAPYERVFAQRNPRVRYQGIAKKQFAGFMNAICFNLKRIRVLDPPDFILA